ncbi:MAG TPA: serine/threonine protein phosphatase, partial [Acinetobacter ursingii]|nr:serine/threonine protein phosphatase [Acinetobacter ursingii]
EMEQLLSSTFIQSPIYGTRCSNFLNMRNQQWNWLEKTQAGELKDQIIDLNIPLNKQS